MKRHLTVLLLVSLANLARAEDKAFVNNDTFGHSQAAPAAARTDLIFIKLWTTYKATLSELNRPIKTHGGNDESYSPKEILIGRVSNVLGSMLDLRAFSTQNQIQIINPAQKAELLKINDVLTTLNLSYDPDQNQRLVEFCSHAGSDKIIAMIKTLE